MVRGPSVVPGPDAESADAWPRTKDEGPRTDQRTKDGRRTKHQGPRTMKLSHLTIATVVSLALTTTIVRAHDPGLSTLDVVVHDRDVSVTLAMSTPDVAIAVQTPRVNVREGLLNLVRDSVHVTIDDRALAPESDAIAIA